MPMLALSLRWIRTHLYIEAIPILTFLLTGLQPWILFAQQTASIPVVTRATAIENARIITAPGRVIERGVIVMRNGLITHVGVDVEIPYDAQRIDGDSLTVYAGFIDGFSQVGIPTQDADRNNDPVEDPGNPPYARAGIQPDRTAASLLDPSDETIAALRNAGFTTAHVAPTDGMLPGSGTIIQLAGTHPKEMVLKEEASLVVQFEGAQGVYPATPIANLSTMRQLYREAYRRRQIEALYADNPSGLERPPFDPVHAAFYPVINGEKPVFFYTKGRTGALETHRALTLQKALEFPLFLAGLNQAFELVDELKAANCPLFLTLGLPEAPKESKSDSSAVKEEEPTAPYDPDNRTLNYQDVDDEKNNLEARQAMTRDRYYSTAAELYEAGLSFGLMTLEVKPQDIQKNIRTMIEHGLPEDAALAALTIDAAGLLGLSQRLGSLTPGKIANLIVTKGSYFEEDSEIRYVFVDGIKYTVEKGRNN